MLIYNGNATTDRSQVAAFPLSGRVGRLYEILPAAFVGSCSVVRLSGKRFTIQTHSPRVLLRLCPFMLGLRAFSLTDNFRGRLCLCVLGTGGMDDRAEGDLTIDEMSSSRVRGDGCEIGRKASLVRAR